MKNGIIRVLAALLTVWYLMGVIGFDVHTCSGSGRSFVTTFIEGLACEDIHPEHSCDVVSFCNEAHSDCCSHESYSHDCLTIEANSCCSDEYQVLVLTGTPGSNDHDHFDECACGHCPCIGFCISEISGADIEENLAAYIHEPDSGFGKACERQAALRVWRI